MGEQMAQDTDRQVTVIDYIKLAQVAGGGPSEPLPEYPDTVEMGTGHTREAELAQLQAELQTALRDKADVEVERAVTVDLLRIARESRARLVCYIRGL